MPIKVTCPDCDATIRVPDESAGRKVRCKACGTAIKVPALDDDVDDVTDDVEDDDRPVRRRPSKPAKRKKSGSSLIGGLSPAMLGGLITGGFILLFGTVALLAVSLVRNPPTAPGATGATMASASELFPVATVPVPTTYPELGSPRILQPSGVRMYFMKANGAGPGQSMGMRLYLPPQDAAPHSIPCVLVAPAGTNLLVGSDMDADDYHAETLPYAEAGMAVVFYSLDGGLADSDNATNDQFVGAYNKFRAAQAGVVNGRNALEFVMAKVPQVNSRQIFSAGHSSAGTVSLLLAAHEPRLAGSVAYAPCSDVEERLAPAVRNPLMRRLLPDLPQFLKQSSPLTHAGRVNCPVFLFQANDDNNVVVSQTQRYLQQLQAAGKTVEFQTVPAGGHYQPMVDQGIPRAIQWMKQRLAAN